MSLATEEFSGLLQHNPRKFEKMRQKLCWFGICTHTPENLDCLHIWSVMDIHAETEGIYAKKILHRFPRQSKHANKQCFRLHLQIPTSQGNLAIVHTLHGIYAGNPTNIDNRNFTEFSSLYWFSAHVLWKKSCLDQYVSVSPSQVKELLSSYERKGYFWVRNSTPILSTKCLQNNSQAFLQSTKFANVLLIKHNQTPHWNGKKMKILLPRKQCTSLT